MTIHPVISMPGKAFGIIIIILAKHENSERVEENLNKQSNQDFNTKYLKKIIYTLKRTLIVISSVLESRYNGIVCGT